MSTHLLNKWEKYFVFRYLFWNSENVQIVPSFDIFLHALEYLKFNNF